MRGHNVQAIEHFQRALDLYQQIGDIYGQATSYNQIANAYFSLSQWQQADRSYQLARQTFEQIGDVYQRVFADMPVSTLAPDEQDVRGFEHYMKRFEAGLKVEEAAVRHIR